MRHRVNSTKLGRTSQHRDLMLMNLASSLIVRQSITTTIAKAKALRPLAERLVTLGKKGDLAARRLALSRLGNKRQIVAKLFSSVAPAMAGRQGGYIRIVKLGHRKGDAAPMALVEWTEVVAAAGAVEAVAATESAKE